MKFMKLFISVLVLSITVFLSINSWAAFEIHPRLLVEEEFNDNIFLDSNNQEDDWITTVAPGITLTYESRSIEASIDYSLDYRFYQNNEDENLDNFRDVQRADASALFFSGRPFTLLLSETISREAIDARDDNEFNDIENRSTVYHSAVTPEYRLQLTSTFSTVFGYIYDRLDYVDGRGHDSEEHQGRVSLVKLLSAHSEVYARYSYVVHQSRETADEYDQHDYTLGLNQQLGGRTSATFEGGYSEVEYDSGYETDGTNWLVDITYQLSEPMTLSMGYSQDFTTTVEDGMTESQQSNFGAFFTKESLSLSGELFWNNSDYVRLDREDEAYGIRVDVSKPLARTLSINFDTEYEIAEYTDITNEKVDRFTAGVYLNYEYRRFLASLGYRYRINESDLDANDYTNNIVTLSATVRF